MQQWDHETASIQERENARAMQCAASQAGIDAPGSEITDVKLYSRIVPLPNNNLYIRGPRWYVTANIHNLDGSTTAAMYRVWREQEEWQAAQVKIIA